MLFNIHSDENDTRQASSMAKRNASEKTGLKPRRAFGDITNKANTRQQSLLKESKSATTKKLNKDDLEIEEFHEAPFAHAYDGNIDLSVLDMLPSVVSDNCDLASSSDDLEISDMDEEFEIVDRMSDELEVDATFDFIDVNIADDMEFLVEEDEFE